MVCESNPICCSKRIADQIENRTHRSKVADDSCSGALWRDIHVI